MKRSSDVVRQIGVLVLAVLAIVGATIGSGAFGGTPIAEAADGALSATATPVAPGSTAFSIWSVIYAGLVGYAVWQALPAQRTNARQRELGWLAVASLILNAAWILTVQAEILWLSVVTIAALLVVLVLILLVCLRTTPSSKVEVVLVDVTFGLYLGWVTIATIANVAATLAASDVGELGLGATGWSVVLLVVAAAIGLAFAVATRGRLSIALALTWGLAWIAVARTTGELESTPVAVTAGIAAVVTLVATVVVRVRHERSATRAARPAPAA